MRLACSRTAQGFLRRQSSVRSDKSLFKIPLLVHAKVIKIVCTTADPGYQAKINIFLHNQLIKFSFFFHLEIYIPSRLSLPAHLIASFARAGSVKSQCRVVQ